MKLKHKTTGEILVLESGQLFGVISSDKFAPPRAYAQSFNIDLPTVEGLLAHNMDGYETFEDAWAYPTKFRYFATDAEIGAVTKSLPEAIPVLATIRRVNFENGSELYFDTIEPEFENFINLEKLEQNDSIF